MANTLAVVSQHRVGKRLLVNGTLALSGSYAAGGEAVNFMTGGVKSIETKPEFIQFTGKAGFHYEYDKANNKVIVRGGEPTLGTAGVVALSPIATATYPAGVSGDVITFFAVFK